MDTPASASTSNYPLDTEGILSYYRLMRETTRVGNSVIEIQRELGTEEQCLAFLEAIRWPEGVRCLKCGGDKISRFVTNEGKRWRKDKNAEIVPVHIPARHLYQCLNSECKHQFSATAGTIFNDTHLPLQKWMYAVAIMCNAKKGVSAKQLQRDLAVSYKTAWYLEHRIREAMTLGNWSDQKMTGTLEADETYIGGKYDKRASVPVGTKKPCSASLNARQTAFTRSTYRDAVAPTAGRSAKRSIPPLVLMLTS